MGNDATAVRSSHKAESVRSVGGEETVIGLQTKAQGFYDVAPLDDEGNDARQPTEEERETLRRVAGKIPWVAYWICLVELAERASYWGVRPLFANFINRQMPVGGNGYGAPARGSNDTAGALGLGTVTATLVVRSFMMFMAVLTLFFGWLADSRTGRWSLISWGVTICGVAHILLVAAGTPVLLRSHKSTVPFMSGVYLLATGAAMYKPNIYPTLLDQIPLTVPVTKTLETGEKVIVDPEATTERVLLWFYLLTNVGDFTGIGTAYTERYVGWWLSFFIPLLIYLPLLPLLRWLNSRLILQRAGGSGLLNVARILIICFKRDGLRKIFRGGTGFFEPAKQSVIAQSNRPVKVPWNDDFVEDTKRAFQAIGVLCFLPIQLINDNGLGEAANAQSTMFTTKGVPNDVLTNVNSLVIIFLIPLLNYGLYPALRKRKIRYGPIARMTTGLLLSTAGGAAYTILNYFAYKKGPCHEYGTSLSCVDSHGKALVSHISIWWMAIPFSLGGISEVFAIVPAYGFAYSHSPKNMRGFVTALNLFGGAVASGIGLIFASRIRDPYLTWVFGGPTIVGLVLTGLFWWMFHDLDKEEYRLAQDEHRGDFLENWHRFMSRVEC